MRERDHYQLLGLDISASQEEIEAAVRRLQDRADALAYTSPQQSRELWQHIRQVKKDLLAGPDRREAYDRALRARPATAVTPQTGRIVPAAPPSAGTAAVSRLGSTRWPVLAGVGAIVLAALIIALAGQMQQFSARPTLTSTPVALTLSTAGASRGAAYLSGQAVQLQWSRLSRATRYRLQIATSPVLGGTVLGSVPAGIFAHPLRTVLTSDTSYTLWVVGAQQYYWRVQAYVDGHWTRFTGVQHFAVARPRIGVPTSLAPPDGTARVATRIKLCWARVVGASEYSVRIAGVTALRSRATCKWVSVTPRTYRWSVAAVVNAARAYVGTYSSTASLTILEHIKRSARHLLAAKHSARRVRHVLVAMSGPVRRVASQPVHGLTQAVAPVQHEGTARVVRTVVRQQPSIPRTIAQAAPSRPPTTRRRTTRPAPGGTVPASVHRPLRTPAAAPPAAGKPAWYVPPVQHAPPPPTTAPPQATSPVQAASVPRPASPPPANATPPVQSPTTPGRRQPLSPCTPALPPVPRGCTNPGSSLAQPRTPPHPSPSPTTGPGASFRPVPPPTHP